MKISKAVLITIGVVLLGNTVHAENQSFPSRNIDLVVPHGAGTGVDAVARILARSLEKDLGVAIIVENKAGANGSIGSIHTSRAKPDGYTLMLNASPPFVTYPMTQKQGTYDPVQDFTPIAAVGNIPMVLVVSSQSSITDFSQFIHYLKSNADKATYASPGPGSAGQIAMARIEAAYDVDITGVPYKSTSQSLVDISSGQVLSAFVSLVSAESLIQAGKLRPLAIGSLKRTPKYKDVPTLSELTKSPDFESVVWYGLFGPPNLDDQVNQRLYQSLETVFNEDDLSSSLTKTGLAPKLQSSSELGRLVDHDLKQAKKLITQE